MAFVRSLPLPERPLSILNVGAGTGYTSHLLSVFGDVTSLEYDLECCRLARETWQLPFDHGTVEQLPYDDGCYDLVCAFDVLEHVEDDVSAALELRRVCKPGGVVLVTVPAFMFLWSDHDVINHHERRYRMADLKTLFRDEEIIYASYFNCYLFPLVSTVRLAQRLSKLWRKGGEVRSDFDRWKPGVFDRLWFRIFRAESVRLEQHKSFPYGVSLLLACRPSTGD